MNPSYRDSHVRSRRYDSLSAAVLLSDPCTWDWSWAIWHHTAARICCRLSQWPPWDWKLVLLTWKFHLWFVGSQADHPRSSIWKWASYWCRANTGEPVDRYLYCWASGWPVLGRKELNLAGFASRDSWSRWSSRSAGLAEDALYAAFARIWFWSFWSRLSRKRRCTVFRYIAVIGFWLQGIGCLSCRWLLLYRYPFASVICLN